MGGAATRNRVLAGRPAAGRLLAGLFLVASLAGAAPAGAQALRVAQPNAARFPEVTLYAYPTDARGVLIGGLNPSSFGVTEDGRLAEVVRVESESGSLDVCLAVDRSLSMRAEDRIGYARDAALQFIQQLGPEDRAALITFGETSQLEQPLTGDRTALSAAVARTRAVATTTTFYDGVYWAIEQVALRGSGSVLGTGSARADSRRVVVALTDGNDLTSRIVPAQLIQYARSNGVSLCMVALGSDASIGPMDLLARETGGVFLRAPRPEDLQRLYVTLADQLRREYRVTVRSPRPDADATRREVRVTLAGTPIQTDTWYQAPGQGSLVVTVPGGGAAGDAVSGASAGGSSPSPALLIGALLAVLGIGAVLAALIVWMGNRRLSPGSNGRVLAITDSNPRMDLLPLWVRQGHTRIGRGAECELVLDSREVSRVHATIQAANGIFRLVDEGSQNGTYVNGRRVRRSRELRVGDVIRFGDREFRFAGELQA